MSSCRIFLLLAIILSCGFIRVLHADVVFTAIGDTPYTLTDAKYLPHKLNTIDKRSAFIIHLGDIGPGGEQCDEKRYIKVAGILNKATKPVFIVPGDNEWNDCSDPDIAWQNWIKHFMQFDLLWSHRFNVSRQNSHPENFSFVHERVLFIGINIVGGRVHDKAEWKQRLTDNLEWTTNSLTKHSEDVTKAVIFGHAAPRKEHKNYFDGLVKQAGIFAKPILYLHGDGHQWLKNRPFKEAKSILRVQVSINRPVTVIVTNDQKSPFLFDQR